MPRYSYKCGTCNKKMEENHSYKSVITKCRLCGSENSLVKDLSSPIPSLKSPVKAIITGEEVKKAIGAAKVDIKKTQRDLKKRTKK